MNLGPDGRLEFTSTDSDFLYNIVQTKTNIHIIQRL